MADTNTDGHVPPDLLAALALDGDRLPDSAELASAHLHLTHCPQCGATLAELRKAASAARGAGPEDGLRAPSDRVWRAILRLVRETGTPLAAPAPARPPACPPEATGLLLSTVAVLLVVALRLPRRGRGRGRGSGRGSGREILGAPLHPRPGRRQK
ncbi:hypothetical protein [Streptomyces sp. NPDC020489]|uniref:hypothetical protein n=1 Tax=Streptomyces sp. NPDC020489 TaxID=3365077 RepID=UPI00378DC636